MADVPEFTIAVEVGAEVPTLDIDGSDAKELMADGLASDGPIEEASAPNIHGETMAQCSERTGYTIGELASLFPPIERWPKECNPPLPEAARAAYAAERFSPPPPPGVHPRVYFSPDDLPAIRASLNDTPAGRAAWRAIQLRAKWWTNDVDAWKAAQDEAASEGYQGLRFNLAQGPLANFLDGTYDEGAPFELFNTAPLEAFRALIDEDEEGGRRMAKVGATMAAHYLDILPGLPTDWQPLYQKVHSETLGLVYDFIHNFATDEQRDVMRQAIAAITRDRHFATAGTQALPAFPAISSNWLNVHTNLLPLTLSIEGEEGYDHDTYLRLVEGWKKWVHVAHSPVGAPFEGLAKSNFCAYYNVPLAKRGVELFATSSAYNFAALFHLNILLPSGRAFIYETGIGPMSTWSPDAEMFKMAYPTDAAIDIVFRCGTGMAYRPVKEYRGEPAGDGERELESYRREIFARNAYVNLERLYRAIGASAFVYADYEEGLAALRERGQPRTYFCDQRGLFVTRSEWSSTTSMLYVEPRHTPGGHTHPSRGDFVFCGLGRVWGTRWSNFITGLHNLPLINGLGQGASTHRDGVTGTVSGRTLEAERREHAVFAVIACDLADAYRWALCVPGRGEPVMRTPNWSRLTPSPLPWMSLPWSELPNWRISTKGAFQGGHAEAFRHLPMRYFFRTSGLARGDTPYALIMDDIDASGEADFDEETGRGDAVGSAAIHSTQYEWLMQVDSTCQAAHREPPVFVRYERVAAGDDGQGGSVDMLLYEGGDAQADVYAHEGPDPPLLPGARVLRVRVLEAGPDAEVTPPPVLPVLQHFRFGGHAARRVAVHVRTVGACRIKVLLMAQRYGDPAPVTQMTRLPVDEEEAAAGGPIATTECIVRVGGTVDKYTLMLGPDGRTRSSHAGREEGVAEADPPATELLPVAGEADHDGNLAATDGEATCAADEAGSCTDMLALADVLRDISLVVIDGVTYGGRGGGDDEPQWLLSPLLGTDSALAKIDSYKAVADESTTAGTDAWRDEVTGVNRIVAAVKGHVPYVVVVDDVELAAHAKGERHAIDFVLPLASPTARLVDLRDTFAIVEDGPRRMAVCPIFPDRSTLPKPQPEVTWPVRLERYLTAGGVQAKRLVVPSLSATSTMSAVAIVPLGAFGVPTCTPLGPEGAAWMECGGQRDAIQIVDDGNDDSEHCGIVIERLAGVVPAAADGADARKVAALNAVPVESTAEDKLLGHVLLRAHTATAAHHNCEQADAPEGDGDVEADSHGHGAPGPGGSPYDGFDGAPQMGSLEDVTGKNVTDDDATADVAVSVFSKPAVMSQRGWTVSEEGGDVTLPLSSDTLAAVESAVTFSAWVYVPTASPNGWRTVIPLLRSPWCEVSVHYGALRLGVRLEGQAHIKPMDLRSPKLPLDVWFHLSVVWEQGWGVAAFINAKRLIGFPGLIGALPEPDTPLAVQLGCKTGVAWDDVRVFNGRLNAATLRQLFLYSGGLRRLAAYPLTELLDGATGTPELGGGDPAMLVGGTGVEVAEDDDMGTCLILDKNTRIVVPPSVTRLSEENCLSVSVWLRFDVDTYQQADIFRLDCHANKDLCLHMRMRKVGPKMNNRWGVDDGRSGGLHVPQPEGEWRHYVQTYDSGTVCLYLDGVLVGSRPVVTELDVSRGLLVAVGVVGAVKGLSIYNYALTLAEVVELHQDTGGVGPRRGHLSAFAG